MIPRRLHLSTEAEWLRELELVGADPACWERLRLRTESLVLKVTGLRPAAGSILKQCMLASGCDAIVSRDTITCSCEHTDALIVGSPRGLEAACRSLEHQPFGLEQLAGEILRRLGSDSASGPVIAWGAGRRLDFSEGPLIMGILNVTPDSFSDGGIYLDPDAAVEHGLEMAGDGASIVDVGAESTRPGSDGVPDPVQIERVLPVIEGIHRRLPELIISIDTSSGPVARAALDAGATMLNDVRALEDPEMLSVASGAEVPAVLMHMRGRPSSMQDDPRYLDCMGEIYRFLEAALRRAVDAGIDRRLLLVDPGIGFGKRLRDNLEILRRLRELGSLGCPVVVGHSRKSFLGRIMGDVPPSGRDAYTHLVTAMISSDADLIRVHDVAGTAEAVRLSRTIRGLRREG